MVLLSLVVEPINNARGSESLVASAGQRLTSNDQTDPEAWVEAYGDLLFGYALVRLRDTAKAEDVVQETFLAALKARERFAGRSTERTWLLGILKNKIGDYFRTAGRETPFTDLEFGAPEESCEFVADGLSKGAWAPEYRPSDWPANPGEALDKAEFWKAFRECVARLPQNIARVFVMREVEEIAGKEICSLLDISESNLWVMLHRARLGLRRCLEVNWFEKQDRPMNPGQP